MSNELGTKDLFYAVWGESSGPADECHSTTYEYRSWPSRVEALKDMDMGEKHLDWLKVYSDRDNFPSTKRDIESWCETRDTAIQLCEAGAPDTTIDFTMIEYSLGGIVCAQTLLAHGNWAEFVPQAIGLLNKFLNHQRRGEKVRDCIYEYGDYFEEWEPVSQEDDDEAEDGEEEQEYEEEYEEEEEPLFREAVDAFKANGLNMDPDLLDRALTRYTEYRTFDHTM